VGPRAVVVIYCLKFQNVLNLCPEIGKFKFFCCPCNRLPNMYSLQFVSINWCSVSQIRPFGVFRLRINFETMYPFRHFGKSPWMGDQPIEKHLPFKSCVPANS
jgi:hypothetical protein